jgi:hypothetical protein
VLLCRLCAETSESSETEDPDSLPLVTTIKLEDVVELAGTADGRTDLLCCCSCHFEVNVLQREQKKGREGVAIGQDTKREKFAEV